jgi:hypothetical protein
LGGDQTIIRVAGGVAPLSKRGFIAGLLQLQFKNALLFALGFHMHPFRRQCRLDRHGLNGMNELADDRCVDAQTAKCHTPPQPEHHAPTIASIDWLGGPSRVVHRQTPSAAPAG